MAAPRRNVRTTARTAGAITLGVSLAVAMSGPASAARVAKASTVDQGNAICREANTRIQAVPRATPTTDASGTTQFAAADLKRYLDGTAQAYAAGASKFQALKVPRSDKQDLAALVKAWRAIGQETEKLGAQFPAGVVNGTTVDQRWAPYTSAVTPSYDLAKTSLTNLGFTECLVASTTATTTRK